MEEKIVPIKDIVVPQLLMRDDTDDGGIADLAADIRDNGLVNAITVRPKDERYELVAGRRRLKAHIHLGRETIRAVVRELTDQQAFAVMAAENFSRKDLNPVEQALWCEQLLEVAKLSIEEVAKINRQSVDWVKDRQAILDYPIYLIVALAQGKIKIGVAKYLGAIEDEVYRKMYVDQALQYGTTVLQAEYLFRQWQMGLLAPSAEILPPSNDELGRSIPKLQAPCRKCGKLAVFPNIESVFIHLECPTERSQAEAQPPDRAADATPPAA